MPDPVPHRAVEAVIFDLGGVLVDWDPRYLYRKLLTSEIEIETFLSEVCTPAWHNTLDAGKPMTEAVAELSALYPDRADLIAAYRSRWMDMFKGAITQTVTLLEALADNKVPLYALSNFPGERFGEFRAAYPFVDRFDGIILSSDEGLTKPDPRLYDRTVKRFGLDAGRTLFIDDRRINIDTARAYGLITHHFERPENLALCLKLLGLI